MHFSQVQENAKKGIGEHERTIAAEAEKPTVSVARKASETVLNNRE